ncbi:type II toxin-antitoxin system prevent-host-death family antitoxin [Pseudoduganella violacea]|uniref:Antitoxin n=1 Tax=Pseudoduganella violacea TaxID=1715466 RepID=A0A7W5FTY9_9BURK|nr:type II toxin-antitoxin system prevent-host-death family antitoxin [Pseudoduganella violacea]MBB3119390.1 prevent-host-death family protein [Pseudoduganella violacea]
MKTLIISSRELGRNVGEAKKASQDRPVVITERGKPSHVLMSISQYRELALKSLSLATALAQDGNADVELEIPELRGLYRVAELD